MAQILEAAMVICFGVSWPISIVTSWRARSARGKSLIFLSVILVGYLVGIAGKFVGGNITYVLFFYILNAVMVSLDILLYFRNRHLDRQRAQSQQEQ